LPVVVLAGLCHISYMFYLIKASIVSVDVAFILYLIYNVIYAGFSYPAGVLADKIGKSKILGLSYFIFATSLVLMTFDGIPYFLLAFVLYGVFMSVSEAQQRALASDLARSQGFGLGAYHLSFGTAIVFGNVLAGGLAEFLSLNAAFTFASLLAFVTALLYLFVEF